jgi:hypothetical protein
VSDKDDLLLAQLARRNWIILAGLILASLAWWSVAVTQGVIAGGLVAIIGYGWLQRSLVKALSQADNRTTKRFRSGYIVRLAALAAALFLLIAKGGVHPVALSVGLSVVVINIIWTTFRRLY